MFEYRIASQDDRFLTLEVDNDIVQPGEYDLAASNIKATLQTSDRAPSDCLPGRRIATANVKLEGAVNFTNPEDFDEVASQLCVEKITITEKENKVSTLENFCIEAFGYSVGDG